MRKRPKKTTMREVADLAGVSAMTVSKVLGGKPGISEETRRAVREAADKLNYFPNALATSFRTRRTRSIGVVMADHVADVFPLFFRGVEAAAAELGYSTVLGNTGHSTERETIQLLVSNMTDGLILAAPRHFGAEEVELLKSVGIPHILALCSHPDSGITTVQNNNYAGAFAMADYLASSGSRRFLLLALDDGYSSSRERVRGWRDALAKHGLDVPEERIVHVPSGIGAARETMRAALARGRRDWDAVVCGSDSIAIGAIEELVEAGVQVPGQVRVSGFDGIPLAAHLRIPLTTIQQPLFEIGEASVRMLTEMIAEPATPARQVAISGKLVARKST